VRPSRALLLLFLLCSAAAAYPQEDERAYFKDFNWFDIMGLDPAAAFGTLGDHAAKHKGAAYDQKAILEALLDAYASAKELEKLSPYDPARESGGRQYPLSYDRTYSERLLLPWASLLKLNVRSAMQYILLEVLYTKGLPKPVGKVPTTWTLFQEYFGYYVVMKKAG
jgi:hypothetical protein